ncbi:MAG: hypothetical protein ABL904_23065 [Hyphomicrobiaceae bacterium]
MTQDTLIATPPVPPALVAAAFDTLARVPLEHRLEPSMIIAISRRYGGDNAQSLALLARIRAAAIVLRDPRWRLWAAYFQNSDRDARCLFDAVLLHLVASLPLTPTLHFVSDMFFDALLARVPAHCRS